MTRTTNATGDIAADAVIVGGGIIGLATAERLAAQHFSVVVVEERSIASGATGASGGLVRALDLTSTPHMWAAEGLDIYLRRGWRGRWPEVREHGSLILFDADDVKRAAAGAERVRATGHSANILSAREITVRFPGLTPPAGFVGVYEPRAGWLPARDVAEAILRDAEGITVVEWVRALEIITSHSRVAGVRTTAGFVSARTVLLAAGVGSANLARTAGVELLLRTRAVSYCVFTPRTTDPTDLPTVVDSTTGAWLRRWDLDTGVLAGVSSPVCDVPPIVRSGVSIPEQRRIRRVVRHRYPLLANADVTGGMTAYDALTPGEEGTVVVWPEPYGLVTATGWNGGGFKVAPAAGQHAATRIREVIA